MLESQILKNEINKENFTNDLHNLRIQRICREEGKNKTNYAALATKKMILKESLFYFQFKE